MMDEAATILMLDRLIKASSAVEHMPHGNVDFLLEWPDDKALVTESLEYFGEEAQLSIGGYVTEMEDLSEVKDGVRCQCNLFINLPVPFKTFGSINGVIAYIFSLADMEGGEIDETRRIYIFGGQLLSLEELADSHGEVRNALLACRVYNRLLKLKDDSVTGTFYIKSDYPVKYTAGIEQGYVGSLAQADAFISAVDRCFASEDGDDVLMLLKSEVNNETKHVGPDKRVQRFFERLDAIMDNFLVSKNGYLSKFSSTNVRQSYLARCRNLRDDQRKALSNLKSELVVFLAMYFTLSEFTPEDGFSAVNILIMGGLFITAILCAVLFQSDKMALATIGKQALSIREELMGMPDKDEKPISEMANDFLVTSKLSFAGRVLFFFAQLALFIPVLIAIFSCIDIQGIKDMAELAASIQ